MRRIGLCVVSVAFIACSSPKKQVGGASQSAENASAPKTSQTASPETKSLTQKKKKLESVEPLDAEYKKLSEALSKRDGQMVEKISAQILSKDKDNLKALNALTIHYSRIERLGVARSLLERAFRSHPNEPSLYSNLGLIFLKEDKRSEAVQAFKRALSINSNHLPSAYNLGSLYARFGEYEKALPLLEVALQQRPRDLKLVNNYAVSLRGVGRFKAAEKVFRERLKRSKNPQVLYNHAVLLINDLQRPQQGLELLTQVRTFDLSKKWTNSLEILEKKARVSLRQVVKE